MLNKQDFYRRFHTGEFGNHGPMWLTYDEYAASSYSGPVAVRTRIVGGPCHYWLTRSQVLGVIEQLKKGGFCDAQFNISAMAPHQRQRLNGELIDAVGGWHLHGSYAKAPMRDALRDAGRYWNGIEARQRVRAAMNDRSWEWMLYLLEAYPEHAIEFTTFDCCWGTLAGYNTVWWEVRRY